MNDNIDLESIEIGVDNTPNNESRKDIHISCSSQSSKSIKQSNNNWAIRRSFRDEWSSNYKFIELVQPKNSNDPITES